MIRWLSGEWLLDDRPNGGTVVVLRALWIGVLGYIATIAVTELLRPNTSWVFSPAALRAAIFVNLKVGGAIFAGAYTALYARFASQWSYLASVYNQIMAAQVRGAPSDSEGRHALECWKAGFIEDAEDLHLATKPMFAGVIISMLGDADSPVRAAFIKATASGVRLQSLEARVLNPDFRFGCDGPNLLMLSDAFIHEGSEVRNTLRRTYTQWVKSKTGRFSSVSTGF